jgi:hypothetical protein
VKEEGEAGVDSSMTCESGAKKRERLTKRKKKKKTVKEPFGSRKDTGMKQTASCTSSPSSSHS